MARPVSKRADNDDATAQLLKQIRRKRETLRLTSVEIANSARLGKTTVDSLFYDNEIARRYHTANNIKKAAAGIEKIQRDLLLKLKP